MDGPGIDIVSGNNLINFVNFNFGAYDRKGKMNASIQFNGGYALLPSDVYFDPATGGFTFMLWVKVEKLSDWMRIFDFGNVQYNTGKMNTFFVFMLNGYIGLLAKDFWVFNAYPVLLNNWFHLTVSYDLKLDTFYFYLNGGNLKSYKNTGKYFIL